MVADAGVKGEDADGVEDPSTMPAWRQRQSAVWGTPRAFVGLVAAMAAAAVIAVGTFLPWLDVGGRVLSGWDLYDLRSKAGENRFVISKMFGGGRAFDYFLTGLAPLLLAVLTVLLIGVVLIANVKSAPKKLVVRGLLIVPATVALMAASVVTLANLVAATMPPGEGARYGLWVTFAGAVVGLFAFIAAVAGRGRRAQTRWQLETQERWDREHEPPRVP